MRRITVGVALAMASLTAACGGSGTGAGSAVTEALETTSTSGAAATSSTAAGTPAVDATSSSTTTSSSTSTTTTTTTATTSVATVASTTSLPGDPIDVGPASGDVLAVMGVQHDDVLNVRAAPGTDQAVVTTLAPTAADAVATGRARRLSRSIWWEIEVDGVSGWASAAFLGYLGATDDITAGVIEQMGGPATHPTVEGLGLLVAEALASPEEPASRITQTIQAAGGDLSEVTYDVVGFPDDAVRGVRLHVFGESGADGVILRTVEQTLICGRGGDDEGTCV